MTQKGDFCKLTLNKLKIFPPKISFPKVLGGIHSHTGPKNGVITGKLPLKMPKRFMNTNKRQIVRKNNRR